MKKLVKNMVMVVLLIALIFSTTQEAQAAAKIKNFGGQYVHKETSFEISQYKRPIGKEVASFEYNNYPILATGTILKTAKKNVYKCYGYDHFYETDITLTLTVLSRNKVRIKGNIPTCTLKLKRKIKKI